MPHNTQDDRALADAGRGRKEAEQQRSSIPDRIADIKAARKGGEKRR